MKTQANHPDLSETPEVDGRERILRAAYRLFIASGYQSVSMQQIADASGIQKATLYHHFRSKDELFAAIVGMANAETRQEIEEAMALGGSVTDQLTRFAAQSFARSQSDYSRLIADVQEQLSPALRSTLLAGKTFPWDLLETIFANGIERGELPPLDIDLAISMFTGLVWGQLWMKKVGRNNRELNEPLARTLVMALIRGVRDEQLAVSN